MPFNPPPIRSHTDDTGVYLHRDDVAAAVSGYADFLHEQLQITGRNRQKSHEAMVAISRYLSNQGGIACGPTLPMSQELVDALREHAGMWVAIEGQKIVASGTTLLQIQHEGDHPIFFKVPISGELRF